MAEGSYCLRFSIGSSLNVEDESRWYAKIGCEVSVDDESCDGFGGVVAKASFAYFDVEAAVANGLSVFELFDLSGWFQLFYGALYDSFRDASHFNREVAAIAGTDLVSGSLFVVEKIEILPDYRGRLLAPAIIDEAVRLFSGNALVVTLLARPLQHDAYEFRRRDPDWELAMGLPALDSNFRTAKNSLVEYFGRNGFFPIGDDGFMVKFR